jgi:hypothetical protein
MNKVQAPGSHKEVPDPCKQQQERAPLLGFGQCEAPHGAGSLADVPSLPLRQLGTPTQQSTDPVPFWLLPEEEREPLPADVTSTNEHSLSVLRAYDAELRVRLWAPIGLLASPGASEPSCTT